MNSSIATENKNVKIDEYVGGESTSTHQNQIPSKPAISLIRKHTPRVAVPPIRKADNNESLSKLANNMTVLKANHSHLHSFIRGLNETLNKSEIRNPHPFKYIINSEKICKVEDLFLLVYVHTAINHVKQRMTIRQTWGNPKQYDLKIRVVFVLGKSTGDKVSKNFGI